MVKTTVQISGMSCGHCVKAVEGALKQVPGLSRVEVKIGEAVIETEGAPDVAKIKEAIEEEGYEVVAVK